MPPLRFHAVSVAHPVLGKSAPEFPFIDPHELFAVLYHKYPQSFFHYVVPKQGALENFWDSVSGGRGLYLTRVVSEIVSNSLRNQWNTISNEAWFLVAFSTISTHFERQSLNLRMGGQRGPPESLWTSEAYMLFIYLCIYLCIYLSVYLSVYASSRPFINLFFYLSIYFPIHIIIYLSISCIHLCIYVSIYVKTLNAIHIPQPIN
jgi:hypothetical protein